RRDGGADGVGGCDPRSAGRRRPPTAAVAPGDRASPRPARPAVARRIAVGAGGDGSAVERRTSVSGQGHGSTVLGADRGGALRIDCLVGRRSAGQMMSLSGTALSSASDIRFSELCLMAGGLMRWGVLALSISTYSAKPSG